MRTTAGCLEGVIDRPPESADIKDMFDIPATSTATRGTVVRSGAWLYLAGGLLSLAVVLLPHGHGGGEDEVHHTGVLIVAGVGCVAGLTFHAAAGRVPVWLVRFGPFLGTALVTVQVMLTAGRVAAAFSMLYVWIVAYVAYFFRRRDVAIILAVILAVPGLTLVLYPARGLAVTVWLFSVATSVVVGALVSTLVERLREAARSDPLTGLPNRRAWDETLEREMQRAERLAEELSVAVVDVDHFKRYNDRWGHNAGDALLQDLARRWSALLRATDLLARYGGDEFGLILPGSDPDGARRVVERLRRATPEGITITAGVATWGPAESDEDLVPRADAALYLAKEGGRDRTVVAPARGPALTPQGAPEG